MAKNRPDTVRTARIAIDSGCPRSSIHQSNVKVNLLVMVANPGRYEWCCPLLSRIYPLVGFGQIQEATKIPTPTATMAPRCNIYDGPEIIPRKPIDPPCSLHPDPTWDQRIRGDGLSRT